MNIILNKGIFELSTVVCIRVCKNSMIPVTNLINVKNIGDALSVKSNVIQIVDSI